MTNKNVCIAVLDTLEDAHAAFNTLREAGVDGHSISLLGKDHPEDKHIHGYHTTGELVGFWGTQGALWGGLMGVLAGAGLIFVPGIGPLLIGGPLLSMLIGGVEGGAALGGIEAVFAGLTHMAFTKDSLILYESQLKAGKWLVLVHGDTDEVMKAKGILEDAGASEIAVHSA